MGDLNHRDRPWNPLWNAQEIAASVAGRQQVENFFRWLTLRPIEVTAREAEVSSLAANGWGPEHCTVTKEI